VGRHLRALFFHHGPGIEIAQGADGFGGRGQVQGRWARWNCPPAGPRGRMRGRRIPPPQRKGSARPTSSDADMSMRRSRKEYPPPRRSSGPASRGRVGSLPRRLFMNASYGIVVVVPVLVVEHRAFLYALLGRLPVTRTSEPSGGGQSAPVSRPAPRLSTGFGRPRPRCR
jgi:hypothetical protein